MKFFSKIFATVLLRVIFAQLLVFTFLFNIFSCNGKGIIIFDLPSDLKNEIRPKIDHLINDIPLIIQDLTNKGILKPDSVTYATPSYESHISLFYDVEFTRDKCGEIRAIVEQFLKEQKEPFQCTMWHSPEFFYRFIVYRVEESKWLLCFFNKLGDELVKKIKDFKKEDHEFVPHISISQFRFTGSGGDKELRHKISDSFVALDQFLKDKVPNSCFTNSDHNNFFAFDELAFDLQGKDLYLKKDGHIPIKLSGTPLAYSLHWRVNTMLDASQYDVKKTTFFLPELLISVSQHWIAKLDATIKTKKMKSFDQKYDNYYMSLPVPEKKALDDALAEKLKNLAGQLTNLKGKLLQLSQKLNALKGQLVAGSAGAVGGGGVGASSGGGAGKKIYITLVVGAIGWQQFVNGKQAAIVNAANSGLWGSAGIAPTIQNAAGPAHLRDYLTKHYKMNCPTGEAVISPSFNIAKKENGAAYILHAVGPSLVTKGKPTKAEKDLLINTYSFCIDLANANNLEHVAFCSLSSAIFGYYIPLSTPLAISAVIDGLCKKETTINEVRFYLFDGEKNDCDYKGYYYTSDGKDHPSKKTAYAWYRDVLDGFAQKNPAALKKIKNPQNADSAYGKIYEMAVKSSSNLLTHPPLIYELTIP